MLRDTHPKSNGLVRAEFIVPDGLPDELRVGIFKEPRTFKAWIRFSNAVDSVSSDREKDFRGIAIKLFDVDGEKLLDDEVRTHDFLFIAHSAFFVRNPEEFGDFFQGVVRGRNPIWFLIRHLQSLLSVQFGRRKYANPLQIRWFSSVPFRFGPRVVKYALRPNETGAQIPSDPSDDYLFDAMRNYLANQDSYMDFEIQYQTDPNKMPIEDATIPWNENQSPFIKIASIKIPAQVFDSPEQKEFDDSLTFNPWHCLPEHRPLGGINRSRKDIMLALSDLRLNTNNVTKVEPTGDEQF